MQHRRSLRSLGATVALLATLTSCDLGEERPADLADRAALSGWVYTPSSTGTIGEGRGLLIVLHGCAQSYGDLQTHGNWIDTAEDLGMVVSLPAVPNGGVLFGCWDYYGASHSRQSGHSGALLNHVNALLADPSLDIDPDQVYIAGLSSGGGMAMVMGCLAPDVFAGVGIAAGPTVGTSSSQISSVSTTLQAGSATCENLAGSAAGSFDTQLAATIAGTNDYTVAQGYATLNADIFASLYADAAGAGSLSTSSLSVASLPGYQPAGTGTRYEDAEGSRVLRISATGMGHAWPAGSGPGSEISFVATKGVDFARVLAELFTDNNRRVAPGSGGDGGGTGGESGGGTTDDGGGTTDDGGGTTDDGGGTTDDGGGTTDDGGEACEPWIDAVSSTISGHFSRFAVYPGGYGVADITYLSLFYTYGMYTQFTLYQAPNGSWYHDPANIPAGACP